MKEVGSTFNFQFCLLEEFMCRSCIPKLPVIAKWSSEKTCLRWQCHKTRSKVKGLGCWSWKSLYSQYDCWTLKGLYLYSLCLWAMPQFKVKLKGWDCQRWKVSLCMETCVCDAGFFVQQAVWRPFATVVDSGAITKASNSALFSHDSRCVGLL